MKGLYEKQHRVALLNPYHSIVKVLDADPDKMLVGIKNVASIPNTLMHRLEPYGYALHTIDRKSQIAGRAVDTELINPISGRIMSGSSSGTAINVFAGINDLGIGNDGGGSVLAPAASVNISAFISKLIEKDRPMGALKPNTDGITATNSIGFMARDRDILYDAILHSIDTAPAEDTGTVFMDQAYEGIDGTIIPVMNALAPRKELVPYLQEELKQCDVMIVTEGPIDLEGFGDSLFGHFDERTKMIQEQSHKGYVRVANIAGATAMILPQKGLGMGTLLMCESIPEKISRLLAVGRKIPVVHDELIERYFLNLDNYFWDGYHI